MATKKNRLNPASANVSREARKAAEAEFKRMRRAFNSEIWAARHSPAKLEAVYAEYAEKLAPFTGLFDNKLTKTLENYSKNSAKRCIQQATHAASDAPSALANVANVAQRTPGIHTSDGGASPEPILDVGGTPLENRAGTPHPQTTEWDPGSYSGGKSAGLISENGLASATQRPAQRIIQLPNNWTPRDYQLPVFRALDSGIKRAITVWHRRAGKDVCAMHYTAKAAHSRVGIYWHVLPTQRQARKAVWEGIGKDGKRYIDHAFPLELRKRTRDDDMMIEFHNGSIWRCVGGDNFDALVGSNPVGVVFSEFAIMDPRGWRFTSPILAENGGWAWFISTPRGKNHFWTLYEANKDNPNWFVECKGLRETNAYPLTIVDEERLAGMPEALIEQEYFCSFESNNAGTVYGEELTKLRKAGKIGNVRYDARYPVETWWDIGVRDATAIIFVQHVNGEVRVIDFHQETGKGIEHFAGVLQSKGYRYSRHIGPHDLAAREWSANGASRIDVAKNFGVNFTIAPKVSIVDGIQAGRVMLSRASFDAVNCADLLVSMDYYHRKWDEERRTFSENPVHDWSSHACSAWMYGSLAPPPTTHLPRWAQSEIVVPVYGAASSRPGGYKPFRAPDDDYDPLEEYRDTGSKGPYGAPAWASVL